MQVQIAGMAWYRPDTFARLRAMFEDGDKLHRTYAQWLVAAEAGHKRLSAQGIRVVRVDIDPDQFPEWCKAQGLKLDADARNRFASAMAYQVVTAEQGRAGLH